MRLPLLLCLASMLALVIGGGPATAAMCTLDNVPAATLLLPYFEVDWQDPQGSSTVFTVNNASPEPALAHITLWTDWGQPGLDFDVFLTGYDVVTVDLYEMFALGIVPITADAQTDPGDGISPHGLNPAWDGSFPVCDAVFPFAPPGSPALSALNLERIRNGHTGQEVFGMGCMGQQHGDQIARGYITVDSVNSCSLLFPSDAGYFVDGGQGVANNDNVLWGSYTLFEHGRDRAFSAPMVAIEAEDGFNGSSEVPGQTFYGRYDPALAGSDNREPLASSWFSDYAQDPFNLSTGTDLLVWRDPTSVQVDEFYPCGVGPDWLPLGQSEIVAFDQEENAVEICTDSGPGISGLGVSGLGISGLGEPPLPGAQACLPLATQRSRVDRGNLAVPYSAGWLALNLNVDDTGVTGDVDFGSQGQIAQSHVTTLMDMGAGYQVGYTAQATSSACADNDPRIVAGNVVPFFSDLPLFDDDFEGGSLDRWANSNP